MRHLHRLRFIRYLSMACLLLLAACGGGGGGQAPAAVTVNAPANVTADGGDGRITVSWSPVPGADGYTIYYATSPGVTKTAAVKLENQNSPRIIRDLINDQDVYYVSVTAVKGTTESPLSYEVSAAPSLKAPPPAPTGIRAAAGPGLVTLSWEASKNATSYRIYYGTTSRVTKTTYLWRIDGATSPRDIPALTVGTAYFFVITAVSANGEGAESFEVSGIPVAVAPPPAPADLTAVEGNQSATLNWSPAAGAASYNIYYLEGGGVTKANGIKVAGIPASAAPSYTVEGLTNNSAYYFVVTAANANRESVESAQVSATPLAAPPAHAMVFIPGSSFLMGDASGTIPYALPVRNITVGDFYIESHETPYDLWKTVYDWAVVNGYSFEPQAGRNGALGIGTHMPVTNVTWYDVIKWLNARSEKEGLTPVYYTDTAQTLVYRSGRTDPTAAMVNWSANGYRLPTEAEWEKAARAGLSQKVYPWGDDPLSSVRANYNMGTTTSIGVYPAYGSLYDAAGNVWEWVWDWYAEGYDPADTDNPKGPAAGSLHVRKGGAYAYPERYIRCAERMGRPSTYVGVYFGFRAARTRQ